MCNETEQYENEHEVAESEQFEWLTCQVVDAHAIEEREEHEERHIGCRLRYVVRLQTIPIVLMFARKDTHLLWNCSGSGC